MQVLLKRLKKKKILHTMITAVTKIATECVHMHRSYLAVFTQIIHNDLKEMTQEARN